MVCCTQNEISQVPKAQPKKKKSALYLAFRAGFMTIFVLIIVSFCLFVIAGYIHSSDIYGYMDSVYSTEKDNFYTKFAKAEIDYYADTTGIDLWFLTAIIDVAMDRERD